MERTDPQLQVDELTTLSQFLDFLRATMVIKAGGLSADQLTSRPLPTTTMTLGGLVKHLALVEDSWVQSRLLGREDIEPWASAPFDDDPDWDWHSAATESPDDLLALYLAVCERSRVAVGEVGNLDALSVGTDRATGERFSLRWIVVHLIEETARHAGHADLLREAIDGLTGE